MKIWVWFLIFSTTSFANTLPLPEGATALSPLEHLEVLEIKSEYKEICYKTCTIQEFKKLKLRFTLYGCMDELGPVSYKVKYRPSSNDYFLYLSAINIHMKASETVRCFLPKTEVAEIWVDSKVNQDNLVISFLNFSTNKKIINNYLGVVRFGIMAIGGETTGVELETESGTYDLILSKDLRELLESHDGKQIELIGIPTILFGPERGPRRAIKVLEIL